MRRLTTALCSALVSIGMAAAANSLSFTLSASLDGLQEVPAVATPGTGTMTGTYDDVTNLLTWSGSFTGLIGTTTVAHFHGPAGVGASASPRLGITIPLGVTSGPFSGSTTISDAFEAELLGGLWYLNIHSTFKTAGEIRGQVTALPEPAAAVLLGIGILGLAGFSRRGA